MPVTTPTVTTNLVMEAVTDSRPVDQELTVPIRKAMNADDVDSIRRYLGKPRLVATTVWTSALAVGAPLFANQESFDSVVSNTAFLGKLSGYTGIRYTTNIKVVLNATPFQQGKLRLAYYPCGGLNINKYRAHVENRLSLSQMPGVEVTTMQKSMETSVPFLSFQEYYDMTGDRIDPLLFNIYVFSPLTNGPNATVNTVGVTLWVWYTDVELFGASTLEPQSKTVKGKVRTVAAQEERPLSDWLSATSKLATSLSSVPLISSIAAPTAVWTKYASGVANSFGYSRPVNGEPVRPMAPHYLNSISNADGINVGSTLALNKDACSRLITDYSPMGQDEMSINFIKKQWCFVEDFTFTSAQAAGAQLFNLRLGLNVGGSVPGNFGQSVSPLEFLGRLTQYYRGGIEICYKFVKTGFHSGSIAFSYAVGSTTTPITLNQSNRLHRTVVDIQDGDSVCLSYPFISNRDWLPTDQFYGRTYAHVVNPLIAPETVPQGIVVQVYVRAMDDLEFTGYNNVSFIPQIQLQGGIEMQGGEVENDDEIICEPIGGTLTNPTMNGLQMMDSMSESCLSLLSFLKNGVRLGFYYDTPATFIQRRFAFNPSAWTVRTRTAGGTLNDPAYQAGPLSVIRACYAFQRGGYELNIIPQTEETIGGVAATRALNVHYIQAGHFATTAPNFETSPSNLILGSTAFPANAVSLAAGTRVNQPRTANHGRFGLSATLPYRSLYRANLIAPADFGSSYANDQMVSRFNVVCQSDDTILLRPAEDFQLLYWIGVPPMVVL